MATEITKMYIGVCINGDKANNLRKVVLHPGTPTCMHTT